MVVMEDEDGDVNNGMAYNALVNNVRWMMCRYVLPSLV